MALVFLQTALIAFESVPPAGRPRRAAAPSPGPCPAGRGPATDAGRGGHALPRRAARGMRAAPRRGHQREQGGMGWADAVGGKGRLIFLYSSLCMVRSKGRSQGDHAIPYPLSITMSERRVLPAMPPQSPPPYASRRWCEGSAPYYVPPVECGSWVVLYGKMVLIIRRFCLLCMAVSSLAEGHGMAQAHTKDILLVKFGV
jgi:hypothetical protein